MCFELLFNRYAIVFISALLVTCLLACSDAQGRVVKRAPVTVPDTGTWGYPPEDDWAVGMPDLPEYAGWYRQLSANDLSYTFEVGHDTVIVCVDDDLVALDLLSGEKLWTHDCGSDWVMIKTLLIDEQHLYYELDHQLKAVSMASGDLLWSRPGLKLLALGKDLLWVTNETDSWNIEDSSVSQGLMLLDATTGETTREYSIGSLMSLVAVDNDSRDWLAVTTAENVVLCHAGGNLTRLPLARPGWQSLVVPGPEGFLVCEYPSLAIMFDLEADIYTYGNEVGYSQEYLEFLCDPLTGEQSTNLLVSYFNLAREQLVWTSELDDASFPSTYSHKLQNCGSQYAIINGGTRSYVLDIQTGEELYSYRTVYGSNSEVLAVRDDSEGNPVCLILFEQEGEIELASINLASQEQVSHGDVVETDSVAYNRDHVVCLINSDGWNSVYKKNLSMMVLKLDEQFKLIPGAMQPVELPEAFNDLRDRFFASRKPLADNDLMEELVAGGINAVSRMLESATVDDTCQLDALIVATEYLYSVTGVGQYNVNAQAVFIQQLDRLASPELAPVIEYWLAQESLEKLHTQLTGVLTKCGTEGINVLAAQSEVGVEIHTPAEPPFELVSQETYYTDLGTQAHRETQWAEATGGNDNYIAFTADGLCSERDIYLAVDKGADGLVDEVLPTGLTDVFQSYTFPGGAYPVDEHGEIQLTMEGEVANITHHVPIMLEHEEYGWSYFEETEFRTTAIELSALRRDTDGDGLTDTLESLLFTDPAVKDTDGDGLADQADPTPNVDTAAMGAAQRGVARALDHFFGDETTAGMYAQWWEPDESGHPFQAVYYTVRGCGPVAYSGGETVYGIYLDTNRQLETYLDHLATFPAFRRMELDWIDLRKPARELYDTHCTWADDEDATTRDFDGFAEFLRGGAESECFLDIDLTWIGYRVEMEEVDGEYYPVTAYMTWIT